MLALNLCICKGDMLPLKAELEVKFEHHKNMDLESQWIGLLIDNTIARNLNLLTPRSTPFPIEDELAVSILAASIYVRAGSVLDCGLDEVVKKHNVRLFRGTLNRKIEALNEAGLINNYKQLDLLRKRRNVAAHESENLFSWREVDVALDEIYQTLSGHLLLSNFPKLGAQKQTSSIQNDDPNVLMQKLHSFQSIGADGKVYHEHQYIMTSYPKGEVS